MVRGCAKRHGYCINTWNCGRLIEPKKRIVLISGENMHVPHKSGPTVDGEIASTFSEATRRQAIFVNYRPGGLNVGSGETAGNGSSSKCSQAVDKNSPSRMIKLHKPASDWLGCSQDSTQCSIVNHFQLVWSTCNGCLRCECPAKTRGIAINSRVSNHLRFDRLGGHERRFRSRLLRL